MGRKPKLTPKKAAEYRQQAHDAGHDADHDRPMTNRAAVDKARELWGQFGFAWFNPHGKEGQPDWYRVGLAVGDVRDLWKPFGRGASWEAAFFDAKQRGYCL